MKKASFILGWSIIAASVITCVWWLFYWLWNTVAAGIFGAPSLTFWQSVGLFVLINLLTAGVRTAVKSN